MNYGDLKQRVEDILGRSPNAVVYEMVTADVSRDILSVPDLVDAADENDVLTYYPEVYLYGALFHHGSTIGDERIQIWGPQYDIAKREARADLAEERYEGTPLIVRPPSMTP